MSAKPGNFRQLVRALRQEDEQNRAPRAAPQLTQYAAYLMHYLPRHDSDTRFSQEAARGLGGEAAEKVLQRLVRQGWAEQDAKGWRRTLAGEQEMNRGGVEKARKR